MDILYLIGKVLLTAVLLIMSVKLLLLASQAPKMTRALKQAEDELLQKVNHDLKVYNLASSFLMNATIKKTSQAAFVSPFWFKVLCKCTPITKKVPSLDGLYSPVRSIIHSILEIKDKLKRK